MQEVVFVDDERLRRQSTAARGADSGLQGKQGEGLCIRPKSPHPTLFLDA
jgi:hypothetical protein